MPAGTVGRCRSLDTHQLVAAPNTIPRRPRRERYFPGCGIDELEALEAGSCGPHWWCVVIASLILVVANLTAAISYGIYSDEDEGMVRGALASFLQVAPVRYAQDVEQLAWYALISTISSVCLGLSILSSSGLEAMYVLLMMGARRDLIEVFAVVIYVAAPGRSLVAGLGDGERNQAVLGHAMLNVSIASNPVASVGLFAACFERTVRYVSVVVVECDFGFSSLSIWHIQVTRR